MRQRQRSDVVVDSRAISSPQHPEAFAARRQRHGRAVHGGHREQERRQRMIVCRPQSQPADQPAESWPACRARQRDRFSGPLLVVLSFGIPDVAGPATVHFTRDRQTTIITPARSLASPRQRVQEEWEAALDRRSCLTSRVEARRLPRRAQERPRTAAGSEAEACQNSMSVPSSATPAIAAPSQSGTQGIDAAGRNTTEAKTARPSRISTAA